MLTKIKSALKKLAEHPAVAMVVDRMKQPTTRRGLIVLAASLGIVVSPDLVDIVFELLIFGVAVMAVVSNEPVKPKADSDA